MKSTITADSITSTNYMIIKLNENLITEKIKDSFSELRIDKYMKDGDNYRFRAFLQGVFRNDKITWFEKTDFFQSKTINTYKGGIKREFPAISTEIRPEIEDLIINLNLLDDEFLIGCHQIRITVDHKSTGYPAPEGFHQDGFDHVAIIPVSQNNISGGITLLRELDSGEIIYKNNLKNNEILLFKDSDLEHYTSPITHLTPGPGYRDVFILTLTKV